MIAALVFSSPNTPKLLKKMCLRQMFKKISQDLVFGVRFSPKKKDKRPMLGRPKHSNRDLDLEDLRYNMRSLTSHCTRRSETKIRGESRTRADRAGCEPEKMP
jgi:hypothetical protein